jgi:A/G-specific adenine glycosylase
MPKASAKQSQKHTPARSKNPQSRSAASINADYSKMSEALITWYRGVKRDLPWRMNRDPYRIWVSEVMLQQTTVAAVIPFYERFMKRFPTLASLAEAPVEDVLEHWAGLGYYSRARNLHKSAQALMVNGFPRTHAELQELPGFGPYTARAVSSLAFDEQTGVLDGNVIRVLSRVFGVSAEFWKPQGRAELQTLADHLAQVEHPADLNQGMMELGATVCTPQSPACLLCPWSKTCVARNTDRIDELPLKKPRRDREIWLWNPVVFEKDEAVLFVPNTYAPFLKGHLILPGTVERVTSAPKTFDYKGTVTHHDIFVTVSRAPVNFEANFKADSKANFNGRYKGEQKWVKRTELSREIPASMIRKAIDYDGKRKTAAQESLLT